MPEEAVAQDVGAISDAMDRLYWDVRDLYITCSQYGDIGTEADLREHLVTGRRLRPEQHVVLVVAVNEGLMSQGDPHRV
jgi:hypothetical protein